MKAATVFHRERHHRPIEQMPSATIFTPPGSLKL
jgi:hypothetical protein